MKRVTFFFIVLVFTAFKAQSQQGLYLSLNPLSALEPQAAYGLAVGYAFNEQIDVSTEYSRLTKPSWTDEGKFTNVKGFRSVTTMKFTTSTNEWKRTRSFVAAELRVRQFSYDDTQDYTNMATHATISDYTTKNNTKVIGLAALIGKQKEIGYSGKWVMEFTAGVGVRHTTVNRSNTPENAVIVPVEAGFGEMPNYKNEQTSLYFPLAIRVIMRL